MNKKEMEKKWSAEQLRDYYINVFYQNGGNKQLYEDLPLFDNSVVIDAGGYKGEWTDGIIEKYGNMTVDIYEPVSHLYNDLEEKYKGTGWIRPVKAGLGSENKTVEISLADNASSIYDKGGRQTEKIEVVDVADVVGRYAIVDCLKLNVEGAEYEIMERLIEKGMLGRCACYLIQYHPFVENAKGRRHKIQYHLQQEGFKCNFNYSFIWEKWEL